MWSGRSSPMKSLAFLRCDHVIDLQSFTGTHPCPPELDSMSQLVKEDAIGIGIITQQDHDNIVEAANELQDERNLFTDLLRSRFAIESGAGGRASLGILPPIDDLITIWRDVKSCEDGGDLEAEWNCAVHRPLLSAALRRASVNRHGILRNQSEVEIGVWNVYVLLVAPYYSM